MTSWAKLLLVFLQGLGQLAETLKRQRHEENKSDGYSDPVGSFNDKFNSVSDPTEERTDLCDSEACTQCSGKCSRNGRVK